MFKKLKNKLKGDDHPSAEPSQGQPFHPGNPSSYSPQPQQPEKYDPPSGPPPGQGASSSGYTPPQGPPPGHASSREEYAPPLGPPPGHASSSGYTPPTGPPPGHASSNAEYAPPPGPPPGHSSLNSGFTPPPGPPPGHGSSNSGYTAPLGPPPGHGSTNSEYAPPSGPPPGHSSANSGYVPPVGPPPGHSSSNAEFAPPPGPPPGYRSSNDYAPPSDPPPGSGTGYVPPPGPPPSQFPQQPPPSWDPPPYHDWTVIPDTALLPPPPSIGYDSSPTANSTMEEGDRAYAWTQQNPLWQPQNLTPPTHAAIQNGQLALLKAPTYIGDLLPQPSAGHWKCRTHANCKDSSILTNLPMYSMFWDSPLRTQRPKTIYFELKVTGIGRGGFSLEEADAGIAIGFVAPPYPTFRLPGWQRGSLGVHGDDGRKYVNDTWGGVDFTTAFKPNEVVGIGMTFSPPKNPPSYEQSQQGKLLDIEVFFTRDGKKEGGWDGNDELDERSEGGTIGLRGECDLFPAIGVFGGVDFEVFFHPSQWMYRPF